MRLLVVEDDEVLSKNIFLLLSKLSYAVDAASTLTAAWDLASSEPYDCIILDRSLPDGDGLELVRKLREASTSSPILMLTARNQTHDLIEGLDAGADDYLSKPFRFNELTARVRALTRRAVRIPSKPIITIRDLVINTNTHVVTMNGKVIDLSPKEYAILEYLSLHEGQVVDRMVLLEHAWGETIDLFTNTVDVHIAYIRKKIEMKQKKQLILTIRGKGYMLCGD